MLPVLARHALLILSFSSLGAAQRAPSAGETMSKLEKLVNSMAAGQTAAETRTAASRSASDLVILEEQNRRELGQCVCSKYINGATRKTANCMKVQAGRNVCTKADACPSDYLKCTSVTTVGQSNAAPSPIPYAAADEEVQSTELLQELVALKQQEVALLKAALSGDAKCNPAAINAFADKLGVTLI